MKFAKHSAMALGFGLMMIGSAVAAPKSKHDGTWQVQLVTESGICGSSYNYAITVDKGSVRHAGKSGDAPTVINGRIASSGAVNLNILRSSTSAQASGSLSGQSGSGTWKVDSYGCSGRWSAQKRSSYAQS